MWKIIYHQDIESDLKIIGYTSARRVLKAIDERILHGDPEKTGKLLQGNLSGCRRIRVGNMRIVYSINNKEVIIFIIAVGLRKDDHTYKITRKRKTP